MLYLLDTNIVSAVMSPARGEAAIDWLNRQDTVSLHISTITIAEIGYGLWIMPEGKRRRDLDGSFEQFVAVGFDRRILDFDEHAARLYPEVMGRRRAMGRRWEYPMGRSHRLRGPTIWRFATRNVRDFEHCGLDVVNPFESET